MKTGTSPLRGKLHKADSVLQQAGEQNEIWGPYGIVQIWA
jgi:hypothetical protein